MKKFDNLYELNSIFYEFFLNLIKFNIKSYNYISFIRIFDLLEKINEDLYIINFITKFIKIIIKILVIF